MTGLTQIDLKTHDDILKVLVRAVLLLIMREGGDQGINLQDLYREVDACRAALEK